MVVAASRELLDGNKQKVNKELAAICYSVCTDCTVHTWVSENGMSD